MPATPAKPIMLHDGAETARGGARAQKAPVAYRRRAACPECAVGFTAASPRQAFCTPSCQTAFQNRNAARGRASLTQLALAWRAGRNVRGDTPEAKVQREVAKRAFAEMCQRLDEFGREDRAAGRDAIAYLRRRWAAEGTL
jgi:hypothetical protein